MRNFRGALKETLDNPSAAPARARISQLVQGTASTGDRLCRASLTGRYCTPGGGEEEEFSVSIQGMRRRLKHHLQQSLSPCLDDFTAPKKGSWVLR